MMADIEKSEPVSHLDSKAPQGMQYVNIDPVLQKRVVRKLDLNLMPLVMALCMFALRPSNVPNGRHANLEDEDLMSALDRGNIGNAQTAGMSKALSQSDADYQWLLTIFYIPYILFEWMALMWKLLPPHLWAFVTVFTWYVKEPLSGMTIAFTYT